MPDSAVEQPRRGRLRTIADLLVAGLLGRWTRYEIADRSMVPTLLPGDWTIGVTRPRSVRRGDVIVCEMPGRPGFEIVKRVEEIEPGGSIRLAADNREPGSVDSEMFGSVPGGVSARLALRYRPLPPRLVR